MFSFLSKVRYSECDARSMLSATALVNYLQDILGFDCELCGRGFTHLKELHRAWFILGWRIEISAPLSFLDDICISTWTSEISSYSVRRSFVVEREDGTVAVRASAALSLVDTTTGHAMRVPPAEAGELEEDLPDDLGRMHLKIKVKDDVEGQRLAPIQVNTGHLDLNNHVNNGQYVQLADDCMRKVHHNLAPAVELCREEDLKPFAIIEVTERA